MAFKIVRNDITKMHTEAIVNTANAEVAVGMGCDSAVYKAAGEAELLAYRREHIGRAAEGEVFLTPGFLLPAKYIIHAVSPLYLEGSEEEEAKLRSCYRKSLELALEHGIRSVAFPLIATGGFGYPKEEGMRIAVDEIHAFLLQHDMDITLVVFDDKAKDLGTKLDPKLEEYIDRNYVEAKREEEYGPGFFGAAVCMEQMRAPMMAQADVCRDERASEDAGEEPRPGLRLPSFIKRGKNASAERASAAREMVRADVWDEEAAEFADFETVHESKLEERMGHLTDTFSEYLLYLIHEKQMENAEVYKRAIVDKKIFSKIKNNPEYHPQKLTALCLCVGAKLNMDETKDLLARAGYALSPCDKTDIIFSYFIENGIYDMIELDIQLEEHGLPCIIS